MLDLGLEYVAWIVSFLFAFLGLLMRTVYPYLQKARESKEPITWDHRYTITALSNVALSFISTMLLFNTWSPPEGTLFQVAIASFFVGWGAQDVMNRQVS